MPRKVLTANHARFANGAGFNRRDPGPPPSHPVPIMSSCPHSLRFIAFRSRESPRITRTARLAVRASHPDFRYQPIVEPEELGKAGESNGYRAALVGRQLTPGLISSLPGTVGLLPFISF